MKRFLTIAIALLMVMTIAGCKKRTNSAGTLKLASKKGSSYVVESVDDSLALGKVYYLVEDEKLTGIEIKLDSAYEVIDFALTIGSDHASVEEKKNGDTVTYSLPTALKLIFTEDEATKANTKTIKVYVKAQDKNKSVDGYTGETKKDSSTTVSVTCESLIEFCLNKEI